MSSINRPDDSDMADDMIADAKIEAARILQRSNDMSEEEVARDLKKFFDQKYEPNWHCIVGKSFASFFTCEAKHYIFFHQGQVSILLYKLGC